MDLNVFDETGLNDTDTSDSNFTIGIKSGSVDANFSYTIPAGLDNEESVYPTTTLKDTSIITDANAITWKWLANGTVFSTDQNTTKTFYSSGDHNVCLIITVLDATDTNIEDTQCYFLTVSEYPQGLDYNFSSHEQTLKAWNFDFNAFADNDANVVSWVWDFNDGTHLEGKDLNYTFTTEGDYNVCLTATTNPDLNKTVCKKVAPYSITVNVPLNEKDFASITPFSVRIESASSVQDLNNQNSDITFYITKPETYRIKVYDTNNVYYPRVYYQQIVEGTYSYIIQPYLTDELYTLFYVFDEYSKTPLNNIKIKIKKIIGGVNTIVQEMLTDGTGTVGASFIINDQYTVEFYVENILNYSMTLFPSSSDAIYVYLDLTTTTVIPQKHPILIDIEWQPPEGSKFVPDTNILDFNQTISISYGEIQEIQIIAVNDNNTLYDNNFTTGVASGGTYTQSFDLNSINTGYPIYYTIVIKTTDGNFFVFNTSYVIKTAWQWGTFETVMQDIKNTFGETFTNIAAIFITLIICGAAASITAINYKGISLLGGIILGLFVFFGWLNFYLFSLTIFGILAVWLFEG